MEVIYPPFPARRSKPFTLERVETCPEDDGGSSGSRPPRVTKAALFKELEQDLRPRLSKAKAQVSELADAANSKKAAIAALVACRQQAAESLGSLSRQQLSEIKRLCRSPPENVKRTLAAVWLLLHASKFSGKPSSAVQFDEIKDWQKCQKMLGDDNFIARILEYDTAVLISVPQVLSYVVVTYLGKQEASEPSPDQVMKLGPSSSSDGLTRPGTAKNEEQGSESRSNSKEGRSSSKGAVDRMQSRAQERASGVLRRSSTTQLRMKGEQLPPLEHHAVTRASEPCGRLLLWMQRLQFEVVERARLEGELAQYEAKLQAAQQVLSEAELETGNAEAALATMVTPRVELGPLAEVPATPSWTSVPVPKAAPISRSPRKPILVALLKPLAPAKQPEAPPPKEVRVELDVTGELASVQAQLVKLKTAFGKGNSEVSKAGCGEGGDGTASLPRLAELLKEHRDGRLKLLLEGHRQSSERDGTDLERAKAVMEWLVDVADVSPGLLRVIGRGTEFNDGAGGRLVLAQPLRELVPLYGPITPEAAAARAPVGIYFEHRSSQPGSEAAAILKEMAAWLAADKSYSQVIIEGHSDRLEAQAMELAQGRAKAVCDLLIQHGANAKKLKAEGLGSNYPLSLKNKACNRRVEICLKSRS